jgi:hypothetical protein
MKTVIIAIALAIGLALFATPGQTANDSDHGLFCTCSSPADTAVYAGVKKFAGKANRHYTLHISATASGSAGTFVINFRDGDTMGFQVPADTSVSTTQALGGVPGVDDIVKITQTGGVISMMVSVLAEAGARDPFDETLDGVAAQNDNFVVTEPGEAGHTSAASIFLVP